MSTFYTSLKSTLTGYATYRGREGHLSFVLHRITGLGTLLFLTVHIVDTSWAYFAPDLYNEAISLYASVPYMLGEIILVFCVIFHGVNGLRLAYYDMFKPAAWNIEGQRTSVRWTLAISIVMWLPAAGIMGYHLLHETLHWI